MYIDTTGNTGSLGIIYITGNTGNIDSMDTTGNTDIKKLRYKSY